MVVLLLLRTTSFMSGQSRQGRGTRPPRTYLICFGGPVYICNHRRCQTSEQPFSAVVYLAKTCPR